MRLMYLCNLTIEMTAHASTADTFLDCNQNCSSVSADLWYHQAAFVFGYNFGQNRAPF